MIYLDNNATTPIDPRVKEAILQEMEQPQGNPSSVHAFGQAAKSRLTKARRAIAAYLKVKPHEILFTSGATEGINLLLRGLCQKGQHLITSTVEHPALFETAKYLEAQGVEVTYLPVGLKGSIELEELQRAIRPNTRLIALLSVNNETGVKNDIEGIAEIAERNKILFFVDGVAHLGKESFHLPRGVSAACFSGHKIHAPQGIGFVYAAQNLKLKPLLFGGVQEYQKRGGTENLIGAVALAESVRLLSEPHQMGRLRDLFERELQAGLEGVSVNGLGERICNTSNLSFEGVDGELLLAHLDMAGVAASHGSACSAGSLELSRVLINMGLARERAAASLRFSLSRMTTESEIYRALQIIIENVTRLRIGNSNFENSLLATKT
jgi:cysteine desulfurase